MKETMSPRERMLTALSHKKPDRTPYCHASFTPPLWEMIKDKVQSPEYAHYFEPNEGVIGPKPAKKKIDYSQYYQELPPEATITEWGVAHIPGSVHHFVRYVHPLADAASVKDILEYPFPDYTDDYRFEDYISDKKKAKEQGLLTTAGGGHMFEQAWALRGMENMLMDFIDETEMADALLDKVAEIIRIRGVKAAEADVDMLKIADDVGSQKGMIMSPDIWRRFMKPRWKSVIDTVKRIKPDMHIWYHSDGDISTIIPELIEIGIDVLNPIQPECLDPKWVKKNYGEKITLWGTIGTQSIMPFGTPQQVEEYVIDRINTLGYDGGLYLEPTHTLEPEVPWENILAFVRTAKEYESK